MQLQSLGSARMKCQASSRAFPECECCFDLHGRLRPARRQNMADASQDRRKRALTDLSNAPLARPLKAVFLAPSAPELEPQPAAAAPVAGSQAQQAAGDQAAKPEQMLSEAAAPEASRPASNDASSDSDVSATSPSTPSPRCEQSEQQSAYLLMKVRHLLLRSAWPCCPPACAALSACAGAAEYTPASYLSFARRKIIVVSYSVYLGNKCVHELQACEREEAAEDRAEQAEEALETSNRKLQEAEAALEVAQERVKLLEVQLLNRAVSHAKLDCIKAADSDCLVRDSPSEFPVRCPACSPACRCSKQHSVQ